MMEVAITKEAIYLTLFMNVFSTNQMQAISHMTSYIQAITGLSKF